MAIYFSLAIADSMIPNDCMVIKKSFEINNPQNKELISRAINCCNISHTATIAAINKKLGICLNVPDFPPSIKLEIGDELIVASIRLPRLTENRHYSNDEVNSAQFVFSHYMVKHEN